MCNGSICTGLDYMGIERLQTEDLLEYCVLSLLSTGSTHEDRKHPDITEKLLTGA